MKDKNFTKVVKKWLYKYHFFSFPFDKKMYYPRSNWGRCRV